MTISTCYGDKYPSKYLFQENIDLFNDVIHVYSWLVSWKKLASVPFLVNFSCWKCADDGCLGSMVSLLIDLLYASLQLPLDNRENKNSQNVCLSQIRENIFSRKFLLIQYKQGKIQPNIHELTSITLHLFGRTSISFCVWAKEPLIGEQALSTNPCGILCHCHHLTYHICKSYVHWSTGLRLAGCQTTMYVSPLYIWVVIILST